MIDPKYSPPSPRRQRDGEADRRRSSGGIAVPFDYYDWRQIPQTIADHPVTLVTKPGASGFGRHDEADVLLGEALIDDGAGHVLVLNGRAGLVGVAATMGPARRSVILTASNLVDVEASRRTMAINGVKDVAIHHSHGTYHVPGPVVADAISLRIPKGRYPLLRLLRDAYQVLRPGGRLYVGGANDEGIKSALEKVERIFGSVEVRVYRGGARVGIATRVDDSAQLPADLADPLLEPGAIHRFRANLRGHDVVICSRPGVFSWDRLDDGTRALIDSMRIDKGDRVLDLGCGNGAVGLTASLLSGSGATTLVDVDIDAIDASAATMAENGRHQADVLPSDSITAVIDRRFDVVVSNPPFHVTREVEYDVSRQFIRDAASVLIPRGRMYLVANRFIPYEVTMAEVFASVETASDDGRFKVLVGSGRLKAR